jgi:hypothetical protein
MERSKDKLYLVRKMRRKSKRKNKRKRKTIKMERSGRRKII